MPLLCCGKAVRNKVKDTHPFFPTKSGFYFEVLPHHHNTCNNQSHTLMAVQLPAACDSIYYGTKGESAGKLIAGITSFTTAKWDGMFMELVVVCAHSLGCCI
jgi:hypothetical protein